MSPRLRLAYFSPLPPARSGIADYSQELLPHLAEVADVTVFIEDPSETSWLAPPPLRLLPIASYAGKRWEYDITLYQMGNSFYHAAIYKTALRYPGIVVLHEHGLHHFVTSQTLDPGRPAAYAREMGYALGAEGLQTAREVGMRLRPPPFFETPLTDRLLDRSLGVMVHSRSAQEELLRRTPTLRVAAVPAPVISYSSTGRRAELGLPGDALLFATFGLVTPEKQIGRALRAFAHLRANVPNAFYLVVGDCEPAGIDLPALVRELALEESVLHAGYAADLDVFVDLIAAADVVINLRLPTQGEASATALRALAAGRPLVVFAHGWYAELPDDVCIKVQPGDDDALLIALTELADQPRLRDELGRRAAAYAAQAHSPDKTAAAYIEFVEGVLRDLRHHLGGAPT